MKWRVKPDKLALVTHATTDDEQLPFSTWMHLDAANQRDLIDSLVKGQLVGIVDEESGGIVGYFIEGNQYIIDLLNVGTLNAELEDAKNE